MAVKWMPRPDDSFWLAWARVHAMPASSRPPIRSFKQFCTIQDKKNIGRKQYCTWFNFFERAIKRAYDLSVQDFHYNVPRRTRYKKTKTRFFQRFKKKDPPMLRDVVYVIGQYPYTLLSYVYVTGRKRVLRERVLIPYSISNFQLSS